MKKIWVVFIIIIFVFFIDFITEKYTNKVVLDMNYKLDILKEEVKARKKNIDVKKLSKTWGEYVEKLSFYQDHEELDKITIKFVLLDEQIELENYLEAINSISEIEFLIDIMIEKQKLILKNIF